mgnify:CR=1 FL=1
MPVSVQDLLIEVLETGEYSRIGSSKKRSIDFKVVSTSATSLDTLVENGQMTQAFRDCICEDVLFFPPLRETVTDIVPMATFFLQHLDKKRRLNKDAKHKLEVYPWPGNVRELVRVIELAVKKFGDDIIRPEHLSIAIESVSENVSDMRLNDETEERDKIIKALESCGYRRETTADILGISRRNLFQKIKQYGIEIPKRRIIG